MKPIVFSKEEQGDFVLRIKAFVRDELDAEIGDLQAAMLVDFFSETLGHAVYNRALYDAQALIAAKADEMAEALYQLERKA